MSAIDSYISRETRNYSPWRDSYDASQFSRIQFTYMKDPAQIEEKFDDNESLYFHYDVAFTTCVIKD